MIKELLERVSTPSAIVLGLMLAAIYYSTPLFDDGTKLTNDINGAKVTLKAKENEKKKIEEAIEEAKLIRDRLNLLSEKFKQAVQYLPTEWKEDTLIADISKQAQISGITVVKLNSQRDRIKTGVYEEMKIDFEIKGSFASIMIFVSSLTKLKRIIEVGEISMKSDDPESESPSITSIGKFTTYRYIPPQERKADEAVKQ